MNQVIDRRTILKAALGAGAAAVLPRTLVAQQGVAPGAQAGAFRCVHLSDIHVQPELSADRGMAKALAAVEALDPKPDFILLGGDQIFDAFEQDEARARMLFDMFRKLAADNTNLKMHYCIGNHDVFGWSQRKGVTPAHALYGKKMVCDCCQLPKTFGAFDHKGWRFYVLDTIQPTANNRYEGYVDAEQLAWLEADLAAKPAATPAVVVSHIPVLTVTGLNERTFVPSANQYQVPSGLMCRDSPRLTQLFAKHNVKLALSGHIHELDRIELRGVTYICDGAVSGNWWKGQKAGYEEGFGVLDLKTDGTIAHRYHDYGWEAQA